MNETIQRILSGIVIAVIVVATLWSGPYHYWLGALFLLWLAAAAGLTEFYRIARGPEGAQPVRKIGQILAAVLVVALYAEFLGRQSQIAQSELPLLLQSLVATLYAEGRSSVPLILAIGTALVMSWQLIYRPLDGTIHSISVTLFGLLYTTLTIGHAILLLALPLGLFWFYWLVLVTTMSDVGAYFAGRWFGKHNAGLRVSPRKTYEGYAGGFLLAVASAVAGVVVANQLGYNVWMGVVEAAILGGLLSIVAVLGDLSESALKRDARIKDSASTIPGHGGMLDLYDALLFTVPIGYYYLFWRGGQIVAL